ncbi:MAG: hypothetical protein ACOY3I_01880 [Verrucomicrobiota bacterium]
MKKTVHRKSKVVVRASEVAGIYSWMLYVTVFVVGNLLEWI